MRQHCPCETDSPARGDVQPDDRKRDGRAELRADNDNGYTAGDVVHGERRAKRAIRFAAGGGIHDSMLQRAELRERTADGGDNAVAAQSITEAVQALFGVEAHKIKIMKRA